MNYWITTDTHFGHDKCTVWCNRPKKFETKILKGLKNYLREKDVLIHLGDIAWNHYEEWQTEINKLLCKKWLVIGNHDKKSKTWYLENGWDFVANSFQMIIFGKNITFSHKPIIDFKGDLNIHGHFHNVSEEEVKRLEPHFINCFTKKYVLVALENCNYQPVLLKKLVQRIKCAK